MRKRRWIVFAVVGALALTSAAGATAASAAQFRAEQYPASFNGVAQSPFEANVTSGRISCNQATLSGAASAASSEVALTPAFSGCKAFGALKATIKANSCGFIVHSTNEAAPYSATMDIDCSNPGDAIVVTTTGDNCVVSIPAQVGITGVSLANQGTARSRTILATLATSGLQYSETGSECRTAGAHSNGSAAESWSLSGFSPQRQLVVGVYVGTAQVEEEATFQAEKYPALLLSNSSLLEITTDTGHWGCSAFSVSGESLTNSSDLALVPSFGNCKQFGVLSAPVATNGCTLVPYTLGEGLASALNIACEAGKEMVITVTGSNCVTRIPSQMALNSISVEDKGSEAMRDVVMKLALIGISYSETGSECNRPGAHSDGQLLGTVVLRGYKSVAGVLGAQQGFWAS